MNGTAENKFKHSTTNYKEIVDAIDLPGTLVRLVDRQQLPSCYQPATPSKGGIDYIYGKISQNNKIVPQGL